MKLKVIVILIFVVAALGSLVYFLRPKPTYSNMDEFAQCLNSKGTIMYGSKYCPHCLNEKSRFGDSFKYINYVECTENPQLCTEKEINAVPVWEIGGQRYVGEQGLEKLSEISGCSLTPTK